MLTKTKIETNFFCKSNQWSKKMKKIKNIVSKILLTNNCGFKNNTIYYLKHRLFNDRGVCSHGNSRGVNSREKIRVFGHNS